MEKFRNEFAKGSVQVRGPLPEFSGPLHGKHQNLRAHSIPYRASVYQNIFNCTLFLSKVFQLVVDPIPSHSIRKVVETRLRLGTINLIALVVLGVI